LFDGGGRMRVPIRAVLVLVLAIGLAGCSSASHDGTSAQPSAAASDSPPQPGADCQSRVGTGKPVRFGSDGATNLGGVVFGTGRTGIVLSHQVEGSLCQWAPYAVELAKRGYRVLAFDFPGFGYSSEVVSGQSLDGVVVAAAALLRSQGASTIVLIGASMGGTASLVAATEVQPAVAGVISVSGPTLFQDVAASKAAPKLTVPVLYAAGRADDEFARDAQTLYDATPATTDRKLVIVGAGLHGVDLVADGSEVEAAVTAFLSAHAPA
jgi:pimeloyl-ACP methyl ester carboxylesterase